MKLLGAALELHGRLPSRWSVGGRCSRSGWRTGARSTGALRASVSGRRRPCSTSGAPIWRDRARRELGRISGRAAGNRDELTSTERQIAELVATGRSNREVAAEMFIAVRTVEANLTRVYAKVGVRSRSELAARRDEL